ncbi:efflux RND transporter permease subunit [Allohahella sp. A8]|uniref:efflux RND transporter permease subunit n=1 Tax=Allohahella sp. A8 TaxID=3141461 RepID=UPI000C0A5A5D|nr:CusA/CzcA family heavy metal efflux RND transporter [Hahellaceae bacterium]|tara:strand:+ start:5973 stop:9128 length:3156 start_codon:yes stop_codon:yes gene_type:complete
MIEALIRWSIHNRLLVLIATALLTAWGLFSALRTPLDAIPDLSDVQVIVRTPFPGQAPQIVENQVTYPLTTTMLSVPGVKTVRGYSFFGDSYVYVLFDDDTDLYWARSRVLEYLSQVRGTLPEAAEPSLGPDATGVGWVYEYALVDRGGTQDISQLRALQDWFLKYELKSVPGVSEVATLGGMVKQYQIQVDPERLRLHGLPLNKVIAAVKAANQETGGAVIEIAEAEYMVRAHGYLETLEDFRNIPVDLGEGGTPVLLGDVARIQVGPEMRRGIAELNGEGEVVGGIVVMRMGGNALEVIEQVKSRLEVLKRSLPEGVEVVTVYDRSGLIESAVSNLLEKLVEEFIVVGLVCLIFLFHLRSALVAIVALPLGVLMSFIVMYYQGINANIMSLGGIAIAIGAMVDAAIVMIENAHKKLESYRLSHGEPDNPARIKVLTQAAAEVGPALFFSLLIITLSFVPVFTLEAQEGRLFAPLAYTKTYAMAAAAGLSVTLIPVLMVMFIRGRIRSEDQNPVNRFLVAVYRPVLTGVLKHPRSTLVVAVLAVVVTVYPLSKLGTEFMPPLNEGDLLYMPTAFPGMSAAKASELLQITDRLIKTVPEVKTVFGKAGRAETATDPAPLEMFETTIQFKPRDQWRPGMTPEKLVEELDQRLKIPGMANVWVQPIRNRIDMLATGIKSPVGIKISGPDLDVLAKLGARAEQLTRDLRGVTSAIADRVTGGRFIDVTIDRIAAARYGLNIADIQSVIATAVGGQNISEQIDGLQRFPINIRYPRELRDSVSDLQDLPLVTSSGATVSLGSVAKIAVSDGPSMIKSENARPAVWVYVDLRDRDLGGFVKEARALLAEEMQLPPGYSIAWSGQFEYFERASKRLSWVVPMTLGIIFVLLFMAFKRIGPAVLILATLPFALIGGIWLLYILGHNFSIASGVGFIALAGLAAEFGVIMVVYLDQAVARHHDLGQMHTPGDLRNALIEGAALRIRPKAMTVATILAGLFPILIGTGVGGETMQRIAAPMVGGMLTAPLLSLFVIPAVYALMKPQKLAQAVQRSRAMAH